MLCFQNLINHKSITIVKQKSITKQQEQDKNKYSEVHIFAFINYINDNYFKDGDGWNPKYKDDWLTTKEIFEIFKQQEQ